MKKLSLIFVAALLSISSMAQVRKVAILETVDREKALTYGVKLMLRSYLAEAVTNTPGYEAYDRTNLQQIFDEQEFQRTGFVSDEDIKKIGEMTGVQFVLVAEASKLDANNLFITAKILNVETARVEKTANTSSQTDIPSLQRGAQDLASRLLLDIKPSETNKIKSVATTEGAYIERLSSNEYIIGGEWTSRKNYYQYIKDNRLACVPAYQQFNQGHKMTLAGWSLFGAGTAMFGMGLGFFLGVPHDDLSYRLRKNGDYHGELKAGLSFIIIGSAATACSVPLLSIGYYKKNNAYKVYNNNCAPKKTTAVTLNLQSSSNGLGLALQF